MRAALGIAVIAALLGASAGASARGGKKPVHHHHHHHKPHGKAKARPEAAPAPAPPAAPPADAAAPDAAAGAGAGSDAASSGTGSGTGSRSGSRSGSGSGSESAATPAAAVPAALPERAAAPAAPPGETPRAPAGHRFLDDMDCSACHTTGGWKLAAAAGASGFDHDRTGFPLRAQHAATTCVTCHTGQRRTTPRECTGCHVDAHQGRNGSACAECHQATDWKDTAALDRHRLTRMPLTGAHALLDCSACHRRTTERTWSDVPADCFACHAKDYHADIHPDHDGDPANPAITPLPRDCGRCHNTIAWSPAVVTPGMLARTVGQAPAGHDARFLISSGKHRGAACDSCHLDPARPSRVACTGCHEHDAITVRRQHGAIAAGRSASSCLRCHPGGMPR